MYAFQLTKMTRGHVKPKDVHCTYCGDQIETQEHVFQSCKSTQIVELKKQLFERIGIYLSEYMYEGISTWLTKHIKSIWNGTLKQFPNTHFGEKMKTLQLEQVSRCAWTGITPRSLVLMIETLVKPKYQRKAARISGHIHSFTSETLMDIWQIRANKLKTSAEDESKKKSKYQTMDDKAKILIEQGLLPGIGGTRRITLAAYMNLPKKHRLNKVKKYLKTHHQDGTPTDILPRIGQRVRSYRLHEPTSTFEKQEAMVTRYTGVPNAPYAVTELTKLGVSEEYIWPRFTHQVPAAALVNRLVHSDGLTQEEKDIRDRRVLRTFDIPQTQVLEEKKLRLRKQGDTRERASRRALIGGVVEVRSHKRGTMNKIVYENMKTETLTTQQLLERETFFDDPRRAERLRVLESQALAARACSQQGSMRTARRKSRSSKRDQNGTSSRLANRDPCGNLNTGQNSEGYLPPTGWSWTRPGLYPAAAPLTPAPRAGSPGSPAGPGLPNGDATGDDD